MGLLDWVKRRGRTQEPEPEYESPAPFGSTKRGNPINLVRSDEWRSDPARVHETRLHIGKSVEGFHGGFQVVPAGGDGKIQWSNARKTEERTSLAAQSMSERWENENARASHDFENNAIREFERKDARQLQVDRKEPSGDENQKPSRPQSKYSGLYDDPPKTESEAKRYDALFDMALVVGHIANDPDPDWGKYEAGYEKAASGIREAFEIEKRRQRAEKSETNARPLSKDVPSKCNTPEATRQQPGRVREWER
jgi:hypothetical protein